MPPMMLQHYRDHYYNDLNQEILNVNQDNTTRFNSVQTFLTRTKAVPKGLKIENL